MPYRAIEAEVSQPLLKTIFPWSSPPLPWHLHRHSFSVLQQAPRQLRPGCRGEEVSFPARAAGSAVDSGGIPRSTREPDGSPPQSHLPCPGSPARQGRAEPRRSPQCPVPHHGRCLQQRKVGQSIRSAQAVLAIPAPTRTHELRDGRRMRCRAGAPGSL